MAVLVVNIAVFVLQQFAAHREKRRAGLRGRDGRHPKEPGGERAAWDLGALKWMDCMLDVGADPFELVEELLEFAGFVLWQPLGVRILR
jgi:hypothetical protein